MGVRLICDGTTQLMVPEDLAVNPAYMADVARNSENNPLAPPACVGPVSIKDRAPLEADLKRFRAAAANHTFMNSATPGVIAIFMPNE